MHLRKRGWLIVVAAVSALTIGVVVTMALRVPLSSDSLRARVIADLSERLDAEVELRSVTLRIYPRPHAGGEGLTVRFRRRHDLPPLLSIDRLSMDADLVGLGTSRHASGRCAP